MGRRKGEDTIAAKRRRMPYVAKLRREDPFKPEDSRELEAACRRVAAASEYMVVAGWREDSATASTTSPPGRRRAPCSTGSTAAGLPSGRCRSWA
jgi:hypothetical protein